MARDDVKEWYPYEMKYIDYTFSYVTSIANLLNIVKKYRKSTTWLINNTNNTIIQIIQN